MGAAPYHMKMNKHHSVFVVEDNSQLAEQLCLTFRLEGFMTQSFSEHARFLEACGTTPPSVALIGNCGEAPSSLSLLQCVRRAHPTVITALVLREPDLEKAVSAMKLGAREVVAVPVDTEKLLSTMVEALHRHLMVVEGRLESHSVVSKSFKDLTPRERQVLEFITQGSSNKVTARALGISDRTVEVHRGRCMEKLGAKNIAELMRIVLTQ